MQHLVFLRLDAAGSRLGVFDVAKEMLPAYPRPGHPGPQSGQHPPNTMEDNNNNNNVLNDQNNNNTLEEVRRLLQVPTTSEAAWVNNYR